MSAFAALTSRSVVLRQSNIDTDQIIPARFLSTTERAGLGKNAFNDWRWQADGSPNPDFAFNQPQNTGRSILLAGANFGCGSSREHAPWALMQNGYRAVIAPSFGDIFYNNSLNNGLLVIRLPEAQVDRLFHDCAAFPGFNLIIDLDAQLVRATDGSFAFPFDIAASRRERMINGWDDIGLTLLHADAIRAFEDKHFASEPWLA